MATVGRKKGSTKTGGRAKGVVNKSTAEIKDLAQKYSSDALSTLASIMRGSDNDSARISAAKELLDRGYGKTPQAIEHAGKDGEPIAFTHIVNFIGTKPDGD